MKKAFYTFATIVGLLALLQTNVQAQAYQKGSKLINVGLGLGAYKVNLLKSLFAEKLTGAHGSIGVGGSFEVGITDQISAGGLFGYSRDSDLEMNFIHIGARGSYHLAEVMKLNNNKIDIYAGAGVGFRIMSAEGATSEDFEGLNKIFIPIHVGGRYYFKDNMAAFTELGTGFAIFQGGISFKL